MLGGKYNHNINENGRLNFPAKLRESLGEKFVVSMSLDDSSSLFVYSLEEWDVVGKKIMENSSGQELDFLRMIYSDMEIVKPDSQGRIVIPKHLREHAGLTNNVTIIGVFNHAEIWDTEKYEEKSTKLNKQKLLNESGKIIF